MHFMQLYDVSGGNYQFNFVCIGNPMERREIKH